MSSAGIIKRQAAPTVYGTNDYIYNKSHLIRRLSVCQYYLLILTLEGSTLTAGPIVVVTLTDFMYVPFAAAGFAF